MKKILSAICVLALLAAVLLPAAAQTEDVRVGVLTGPTGMGMAGLLTEEGIAPGVFGSADELMPLLLRGELDIAAVPANLAATLYQKTGGGVTALAVNVLGVLYLCEYGTEEIFCVDDLRGKTIYATGKGSTPEAFLRYVLTGNGLDPDRDVTIAWKSEPGEVTALLNANGSGIAMLPQPYVAAAAGQLGEGFRAALSVSEEWERLGNGTRCTTAAVVARTEYLRQHPERVEAFLGALAQSTDWVNANPEQAAAVCEELGIAKAAVARRAIPDCNLVCITGNEMKQALSGCLTVIYEQEPRAVGGALPEEDFYYGAK